MTRCPWILVTALLLGSLMGSAEAQEQRFLIGGGGGFATLFDPELDIGRGTNLGGFFGFRINDQFTFEVGADFTAVTRVFTEAGDIVAEGDPATVGQFELNQKRYHFDGSLYYHFGRRKPFHPYMFVAGGVERKESRIATLEGDVTSEAEHEPTVSFGLGLDYYVLYNVAVRVDGRWYLPKGETGTRTRRLFFGVAYYF